MFTFPRGLGIIGGLVWLIIMIVMIAKEPVLGIVIGIMLAVNLSIVIYLHYRKDK